MCQEHRKFGYSFKPLSLLSTGKHVFKLTILSLDVFKQLQAVQSVMFDRENESQCNKQFTSYFTTQ